MHVARKSLIASLALVGILASCKRNTTDDKGKDGPNAGNFDKAALLRAFGECTFGTYKEFQSRLGELDAAVKKSEADGTPASRDAAREAWKKAMDAWQQAELMSYGPAGRSGRGRSGTPGAKDLRDGIYAWPVFSRCLVDQAIVGQDYDRPTFANDLLSKRSLYAVEYVLFYDGPDNGCPANASINADGSWKALTEADRARRRAGYARAAVADVVGKTSTLVDAWDPAKGNFLETLATASKNDTYTTQQWAFNAVSDAAFFIDIEVKNQKIGRAAGLTTDAKSGQPECGAPPCLDQVESLFAHRTKDNVRQNLVGFQKIMRGCGAGYEGLGFDDLLVAVGAEPVAKKLADSTAAAVAALDALKEPTFEEDLQKNPEGVKTLFAAMRAIVTTMKADFATTLDLELPTGAIGDND